ncbi:hypothetical protein ASD11_14550 [Aeromicrobium sp. Root495]|nr:hypothetical protein ASD11_14550 [Aeromicrobium sp. Root495]
MVAIAPMLLVAILGAAALSSAASACETSVAAGGRWQPPLVSAYTVSSGFGMRFHPVLRISKLHTGTDLVASGDKKIVAAAAGTVVERGFNTAYGNQVLIDHGSEIRTRYAHMAAPARVRKGQTVGAGSPLGTMGATGYVTGPHLHFEVIRRGSPINAVPFMAAHGAQLNGKASGKAAANGASSAVASSAPTRITAPGPGGRPFTVRSEQLENARQIAKVGRSAGAGSRGVVIALMTSLQESGLRNLDYGDRDSLGLFQQRPSAGWGSPAQVRNPAYAARSFFGGPRGPHGGSPRGLLDIDGWKAMRLGDAAQSVQVSAFPRAYDRWEPAARAIADAVGAGGTETCMATAGEERTTNAA